MRTKQPNRSKTNELTSTQSDKSSLVLGEGRIEAIRNLLVEYDDQQFNKVSRRRFRRLNAAQDAPTLPAKTDRILNTLLSRSQFNKLHVDRRNQIKFDQRSMNANDYKLKNYSSRFYSQTSQDKLILHLLDTPEMKDVSRNGFFVEAGAFDGETWSNTLHLERFKNWNGILIEPSAENYRTLLSKNRKSYSINSCLCSGDLSRPSAFIEAGPFGITVNITQKSSSIQQEQPSTRNVTCHPLAKILNSFFEQHSGMAKRTPDGTIIIDYMSLDIEGNEQGVIKSFPWTDYRFNLLTIEYNQNKNTYKWLIDFMKSKGYSQTLVDDVWYQDVYFAHESILKSLNLSRLYVSELI